VDNIHFEARDVNPWAEYVDANDLVEGRTYFTVDFVDPEMLVPELLPLVFIGVDLEPGDSRILYFQDASSYIAGTRYGWTPPSDDTDVVPAAFQAIERDSPFVQTFEQALNSLLRCSVARCKAGIE
jgi:hypothetical protein